MLADIYLDEGLLTDLLTNLQKIILILYDNLGINVKLYLVVAALCGENIIVRRVLYVSRDFLDLAALDNLSVNQMEVEGVRLVLRQK